MRRYPRARLRMGIEESLRSGNPWIFADALEEVEGRAGDVVEVVGKDGAFVGRGVLDPGSALRVRLWTVNEEVDVDDRLLERRIKAAFKRRPFPAEGTTGFRLLNGEGDRVPGLVCDVYGEVAVLRPDGEAAERWLKGAKRAIGKILPVKYWAVRRSRHHRGNKAVAEWWGEVPEGPVRFEEEGMIFEVDPLEGQKTGFFLDQRANRRRVAALCGGKRVLNLFGYTGGFSVAAARAGAARTTTVDLAKPAIAAARRHFELNGLPSSAHEFEAADVFAYLKQFGERSAPFEVLICDPPSFAHRREDVAGARAKYVELYGRVLEIAPEHAVVVLASCSSHIDRGRFLEILAEAAREAKSPYVIGGIYGADVDHPVPAGFPEADYLQCAVGTVARD